MKREELKALGLDEEQISKVLDLHHAELDPAKEELEKTKKDLTAAEDKNALSQEALKKFEGVDPDKLQTQLKELKEELERKDAEHAQEIADRDFNELVNSCIREAKGVNPKAIAALLDMETLKASKNQKADVEAAIKTLTTAEDSKMLFGELAPNPVGTGNLIGAVQQSSGDADDAALRAAMGLPPITAQDK
ncbi:MAG: phage scaffolding protein [Muribaculum sp.]|nr:phage scaffolding protein [Muribaculum sp.]